MTLSEYIQAYLGQIYTDWLTSTSAIEADVLALYGVETEAEATNLAKLYAIAKSISWLHIMSATASAYNFSADGATFNRSQIFEMAKANYLSTLADAIQYMPSYEVEIGEVDHTEDPYEVATYLEGY